jgi:hypothetical protein
MLSDYGIAESVDYDYDYYERWKEAIVQIAHHYLPPRALRQWRC